MLVLRCSRRAPRRLQSPQRVRPSWSPQTWSVLHQSFRRLGTVSRAHRHSNLPRPGGGETAVVNRRSASRNVHGTSCELTSMRRSSSRCACGPRAILGPFLFQPSNLDSRPVRKTSAIAIRPRVLEQHRQVPQLSPAHSTARASRSKRGRPSIAALKARQRKMSAVRQEPPKCTCPLSSKPT